MDHKEKNIQMPSYQVERNWLYAPSTYLIDSYSPMVEEIYLPAVGTKSSELTFNYIGRGDSSFSELSISRKIKDLFKEKKILPLKSVSIDLRSYSPQNISHAIMIHMPLALWACEYLSDIGLSKPTLIFPESLPSYVVEIFLTAGFEVYLTNNKVVGPICSFDIDMIIGIRGAMPKVLENGLKNTPFSQAILDKSQGLPKKIFISRKDTRKLVNEESVEEFLSERGFQKVYLEEYGILEQIALVTLADNIVAVHGAALGALALRGVIDSKFRKQLKIVEIFSPGHMTNVYRIIAHQIDAKWVGVRGMLWPGILKQAYTPAARAHKFAYTDFTVCLLSLEKAMESIDF